MMEKLRIRYDFREYVFHGIRGGDVALLRDGEKLLVPMHKLLRLLAKAQDALSRPPEDNPEKDATDFAHPAWWRGNRRGVEAIVEKVNAILDGLDDGRGVCGDLFEPTRRRLLDLVAEVGQLRKVIDDVAAALSIYCSDGATLAVLDVLNNFRTWERQEEHFCLDCARPHDASHVGLPCPDCSSGGSWKGLVVKGVPGLYCIDPVSGDRREIRPKPKQAAVPPVVFMRDGETSEFLAALALLLQRAGGEVEFTGAEIAAASRLGLATSIDERGCVTVRLEGAR